jgi:energy-converting hydrogenase Eha subunit A
MVMTLAVLVVFITTYMLILPAITLEKNAKSSFEENNNTED